MTLRRRLGGAGLQGRVDRVDWRWRRATRAWRVLPDFLVLGAQKSATTSLLDLLGSHPDVRLPAAKELHHFERQHPPALDDYRAAFPLRMRLQSPRAHGSWISGEATPLYLFVPSVPARVASLLPASTRFVVVLREPWDRARSHHRMSVGLGSEHRGFAEAVEQEAAWFAEHGWEEPTERGARTTWSQCSYLMRGLYADQLERWFAHVDRERFLVLRFEDLVADPGPLVAELQQFLGLRPELGGDALRHRHRGRGERDDGGPVVGLEDFFAEPNRRLGRLVGVGWDEP